MADDNFLDADEEFTPSPNNREIDVPDQGKLTANPKVVAEDTDHHEAMQRWNRGWEHDRHNIQRAYQDLNFLAGFQWLQELENQRLQDGRPVLTFNRCPQFVRQVTGDMRQMRPAISVVPVDNGADEKIAEIREGLIRHIEDASYATLDVYVDGADSQVACGIGHWEIAGEYGSETDYEQNLVIRTIDDQIGVVWDPDARKKTRTDAMFCFVPVDMTREAYKATYPKYPVNDMGTWDGIYIDYWYDDDRIRVCRYWYKVKVKRSLVKMPDGTIQDVSDDEDARAQYEMQGGIYYERDGFDIYHRMMNGTEFISEPERWPGRFIPIIPLIGEEVRVGGRIERHGIVRFLADPQRSYNYVRSTETEVIGLQPKSPYLGTDENFKDYAEEWDTANVKAWPYLRYTPDPKNGNIPPQRINVPPVSSGLEVCIQNALSDMQGVVGIYASSLGAKSNEDSGVAIRQRESQSDTGTYVYMANFAVAISQTARVLNDLIPHYYDTPRTIRILGLDGKSQQVSINQPPPFTLEGVTPNMMTDITVGTYDIQMSMGPSYATQREAARTGMADFLKAFPPAAPILGDMFADLQDWPQKEEVRERLQTLLPPAIQAQIAQKDGKPPPPPQPPNPIEMAKAQAEIAKAQGTSQASQLDVKKKELEVAQQQLMNMRAELELMALQEKINTGRAIDPEKLQQFVADTDETLRFLADHVAAQLEPQAPEENSEAQQPEASASEEEAPKPAAQKSPKIRIEVPVGAAPEVNGNEAVAPESESD